MTDYSESPFQLESDDLPMEEVIFMPEGDSDAGVEAIVEETRDAGPLPLGERVRRWFFPSFAEREAQLNDQLAQLDEAIAVYPETPTNYVLRGEYYLQIRYNELAEKDFQRAVELAQDAVERNHWGLIAQAMQDRALRGLRLAQKRQ